MGVKPVPPYLKPQGFVPRRVEDFCDGGAFPEIHIAQCPLDMGRNRSANLGSKILPLTVDACGNVAYDHAIVKLNENARKIVHSRYTDLVPKILKEGENEEEEDEDEGFQKEIMETMQETKAALEKVVDVRFPKQSSDSTYMKYKTSQQLVAFNSGAKERLIRMVEKPVDPLEPPKFKRKRVLSASGPPPVPVMHSPPRPVTVKALQGWKIPPCISNWKNPKGYTIRLDKRLAADGRGLHDVQINDNFAKLSESLYVTEQKAREAVAMRLKVQKEMMMKERDRKEQELQALAAKARFERTDLAPAAAVEISNENDAPPPVDGYDDDDVKVYYERPSGKERDVAKESKYEREVQRVQREKIREECRRERRLEAKDAAMGKKSRITRDRDRDISEKVAVGMASAAVGRGGEVRYDQRLFSEEKGMDSGLAAEDHYNVYDKGLFTAQPTLSTLYRPNKDMDSDMYGGIDEQLEKTATTGRFRPGTSERSGPRDRPVEFEKEADPFGLDQFLTEVEKGKRAMEKVGKRARSSFEKGH